MRRGYNASLALLLLAFCTGPPRAAAQDIVFQAGGVRLSETVRSLSEIRRNRVVRQRWDLSCGSAALSTLLTYDLHDPTPETAVIVWILDRNNPARIRAQGGFSLLELKQFAAAPGFKAEGYGGLTLRDLVDFHRPAIVPVRERGYNHFVVFRGVLGGRVFVADPAFGNLTLRRGYFLKVWRSGIGFVVYVPGAQRPRHALRPDPRQYLVVSDSTIFRAVRGRGIFEPGPQLP